jgi:HSP20 family protein
MATLVRWDPFREVEALHNEISRRVNGLSAAGGRNGEPWIPAMDVWETDSEITYEFELPGVPQNEIAVELEEGTLTVSATRERADTDGFGRFELRRGAFARTVGLPQGVPEDAVQATHVDGVLRITVPKPAQPKPRKIEVRGDSNGSAATAPVIEGSGTSDKK